MTDWSKSKTGTTEDILDHQNQQKVDGLASKVSRLRGIALDMESDSRTSLQYSSDAVTDVDGTQSLLSGSVRRLSDMVSKGSSSHRTMCYVVVGLVFLFIVFYYLVLHVTAK